MNIDMGRIFARGEAGTAELKDKPTSGMLLHMNTEGRFDVLHHGLLVCADLRWIFRNSQMSKSALTPPLLAHATLHIEPPAVERTAGSGHGSGEGANDPGGGGELKHMQCHWMNDSTRAELAQLLFA